MPFAYTSPEHPMNSNLVSLICLWFAALSLFPNSARAADDFTRQSGVVYGRKFGTALTMDVFTPKEKANGAAVIWVVSGGWFSAHDSIQPVFPAEFLKRGYTVFAVVHGSQPKFTIPEVLQD